MIGLAALAWPSRRSLLLGAMVGIAAHFRRDLSESKSGVPLLWPWSYESYTLPHWTYLAAMAVAHRMAEGAACRERRKCTDQRSSEDEPENDSPNCHLDAAAYSLRASRCVCLIARGLNRTGGARSDPTWASARRC